MDEKDLADSQKTDGEVSDQSTDQETDITVVSEEVEKNEPDVETSEETESEDSEDEKPKSRRENLRIQQLVEKLRSQRAEPVIPSKEDSLDYKTALDADDEVIKKLEDDRKAAAQYSFDQGVARANAIQFHTRLEIDAPKVASKYPQFDKDAEEFNPVAANAINQWYLATVGYDSKSDTVKNPGVRYADFVEGIMELADEMASHKVARTKSNIAKQAASTGLRPDGSSAKRLNLNQAPETMTDEELDAIIGAAIPKKR